MTGIRVSSAQSARDTPASGPGAVVLGGDYVGLGIVRSLGRLGVPVCVIDDEHTISRFSRYTTHTVDVPDLIDQERAVETLLEVGRLLGLDGWVLFPTRDEIAAACSRHKARLSERYRVPIADWDVIRWAWDKRNLHRLAERLDIPAPRTWYPRDVTDLDAVDGGPPFAVKPAIKERFIYQTKAKAWRANDRAELRTLFERAAELLEPGEVMIQELIPGDGRHQFAYCAFFKDGRALGSMSARRRRQHPPEFGRASTFVETVDLPLLEGRSERLLREIGCYGLVELEYKHDPRSGEYKLLDFNARAWGYHTLGHAAGVDFPAMVFADQMGEPVERLRARGGVRWVRFLTDVPTALVEWRARRLRLRSYARMLLGGFDVEAVFSREDPRPGLAEVALVPYLVWKRGF
jgi:D-aspartate ligase